MQVPTPLFFDSFMFNGEEIVKLRLAYLDSYVDHFYVTESAYTFSGKLKDFFFVDRCAAWFEPYKHKLTILKIHQKLTHFLFKPTGNPGLDIFLRNRVAFEEEKAQRNYIRSHLLAEYPPEKGQRYVLAMADVDEIYDLRTLGDKKVVWYACENHVLFFQQRLYMFNFVHYQKDDWCMAFCINSNMIQTVQDLDHIRTHKFSEKTIVIRSGWHFSFFLNVEAIQRKLQSYSHVDNDQPQWTEPEHIRKMLTFGVDLFMRPEMKITHVPFLDAANNYPPAFLPFYRELCQLQEIPCEVET
jgi:beta-1,4-mannosyl-glycoprotein beta-1,4-N-acetylglucosaminyltransferase